jgi:hypothetical protein
MSKPMPSRPAQFRALLQKAAVELGLPRKHDVTQALATCRLGRRALRDARQIDLLSGRTSDQTKFLAADAELAAEERQLLAMVPSAERGPYLVIQPVKYIERPAEPVLDSTPGGRVDGRPVVAVAGAPATAGVSASAQPEQRTGGATAAQETLSRPRSNVVPIDKNKARDFHAGPHAVLKQLDVSFDPNVGSFRQDEAQRDLHRIDLPWPEPSK